ncbi:MAG TPA: CHAT domain-containing protein, partial [Myxococcales bacterium]|nr:CHAT domain-containing protein [Myxococcales bacterium]
ALLVERQIEEALNILQQAQQIQLNKLGEHELETARVYSTHAEALIANGKCGEATTMMRRSHELLDRHLLRQLTLPEYTDFERQKLVARLSGSTSRSVSLSLDASQPCSGMVGIAFEAVLRRKARAAETQTMLFAQLRRNMTPDDQEALNSYIQAVTEASMQALKGQVKEPQSVVTKGHRLPEKGYLEQGVAARSLRFATQKAEVSLSAIQSALPSDSVLVEFVQFELSQFPWKSPNGSDGTNYAAFVMTSEGKIHRVNLGPKDLIDAQIHQLRKAIGDCPNEGGACPNSLTNTRTEARKLYQQVWAPLLPFLSNASHALISPDGNLNLLPFTALVAPEGPYLLEEMRLTYLSSARDLLRLNKSSRVRGHSAIIAAPAFGNGGQAPDRTNANQSSLGPINQPGQLQRLRWPDLPGTRKEANIIQGLLQQPQVALGPEATETFLKELQGPFILHIATHGYFLGGSEISGDRGIRLVPTGDGQEKLPALSDPGLNSGLVLAGGSG